MTQPGATPAAPQTRHKHKWGYVEMVTETVTREVFHKSKVGGVCIDCKQLRTKEHPR